MDDDGTNPVEETDLLLRGAAESIRHPIRVDPTKEGHRVSITSRSERISLDVSYLQLAPDPRQVWCVVLHCVRCHAPMVRRLRSIFKTFILRFANQRMTSSNRKN